MQTVITVGILLGRTSRTSALPPNNPCDLRFAGDSWLCCVVLSGKLVVALAVWLAVHIAQGVHLMDQEVEPGQPGYHPPKPAREHVNNVKQSRDRAQYVRQQKGHSIILNLLLGIVVLWVNVLYISLSPNHYWHA